VKIQCGLEGGEGSSCESVELRDGVAARSVSWMGDANLIFLAGLDWCMMLKGAGGRMARIS
jgi:hypothetical protein